MRINKKLGILSVSIGLILSSPLAFSETYKILFNKTAKPFAVESVSEPEAPVSNPQGWVDFFNNTCGHSFADENAMVNYSANLNCDGKSISDANMPSSGLTTLAATFHLYDNNFTHVDGLSGLQSVGGQLTLMINSITNVNGLSSLQSVGGNLSLHANPSLDNLSGLSSVSSVSGYIFLDNRNYSVKIPASAPICLNNMTVVNQVGMQPITKTFYCELP